MPDQEPPFRILLMGDFSGRGGAPRSPRKPVRVDRDDFDQVMGRMGVELRLDLGGADAPRLTLPFAELDDFHPDRLFQRVGLFQALRELRSRLADPATFAAAAASLTPAAAKPPPAAPPAEGDLLGQVLAATAERRHTPDAGGAGEWKEFLQRLVAPHLTPGVDASRQAELTAGVDAAIAGRMRALLHHPDFQAVEAAWRSAALLVRRLPTDEHLQIFLLDVSKTELAADLLAPADASRSQTNRLLVEETVGTPGAPPWAVVAGLYTFDASRADVDLLGRLAAVAQAAGAPFLAAADVRFLGCDSLLQSPDPGDWRRPPDPDGGRAWEELRCRPEASFLGLALPRVLLRAPYGKETDATDSFEFEEAPEGAAHDAYLWGNPAALCAYLLADAFARLGWNLRPGAGLEIDGLPLYVYSEGDERRQLPCAEVWLNVRAADAILDRGIMPFLSIHGRDAVRLVRFQSVASPVRPLAGGWGS